MSLYNIPSLRDRAGPWGVYKDRQISIVLPFWVVHLQHPPLDKPLGILTFEGWSVHISPFPPPPQRKKLLKFPTQLFRRRQNRRPWLSTRRLNRRLALRFKFPTPARQRFKFPSLAPGHRRRSNASGFPVRCWDGGLSLTFFSSMRAHDCR